MRSCSKWLLACAAFLLAVTLSGCTLVSTDVTALMSPPKLTKQQQAIEQALSNALGGAQYTLQYPHNGSYRSSFVLHRFENDAGVSAIAFYTLSSKDKTGTHAMVLKEVKGKWQEVCDISGDGNEIDRVAFGNFDGTGSDQIAIGWTSFTSTDMVLGIYALRGNKYEKIYRDTYTEMLPVSMTGSVRDDLLLLKLDSADKKASALLVSAVSGTVTTVGQTPLDSTVTGYAGLYPTKEDGAPAVLIDSRKGTNTMVTEMVLWKDGKLTSPLYDTAQKTASAETLRDVSISCQDIDGDGNIEIPMPVELPGYEDINSEKYSDKIWKVQWYVWTKGALAPKLSSVLNSTEGYTFIFPENWDNGTRNVTVKRVGSDTDWAFYEWNPATRQTGARLFDLLIYTDTAWNSLYPTVPLLQRIMESNGIVYAYKAASENGNSPYRLDFNAVRSRFRLVD